MPRARIESIELESDEKNEALKREWKKKKTRSRVKKPEPEPTPKKPKKTKSLRTYEVNITKRRIVLGASAAGVQDGQPVASYIIEDLGVIEGSRLFRVKVISYKGGTHHVSSSDFHTYLRNGARVDPRSLEGFNDLDAKLFDQGQKSGHVAFPTDTELEKLVVRSSLADFELDLVTGGFTTRRGPF